MNNHYLSFFATSFYYKSDNTSLKNGCFRASSAVIRFSGRYSNIFRSRSKKLLLSETCLNIYLRFIRLNVPKESNREGSKGTRCLYYLIYSDVIDPSIRKIANS